MKAIRPTTKGTTELLDNLMFAGLLLFLLFLPFHLVIKQLIPGPAGTYWKEFLLGVLVLLWIARSILARRLLLTKTPLDWAVLIYAGVILLRFLIDRPWWVGAWGLYASIMYLPLFWLAATVLSERPGRLIPLLASLVAVGAVVSVGGLLEFVWNVPLWPSEEMVRQHGFPGVFIYGTNIRRVYFTFDSPTTLANTLAMLLPLSLALILASRNLWARLAAGLAAVIVAACIVVTFSRGIWVATVLSLVVMGVWMVLSSRSGRGFLQRAWRPLLIVGAALALLGLAWAAVWFAWAPWEDSTYEGVVELSPDAYRSVAVTGTGQDLLSEPPVSGESVVQTWSMLDPVSGKEDERTVLYQHPPENGRSEVVYTVEVPEDGVIRFAAAVSPEVWSPNKGDGVNFQVYVTEAEADGEGQFVFTRYINPKHNLSDRRWRNFLVDLSPWAGRTVHITLMTDAGKAGDWSFDWAGWAEPEIVRVDPDYFAAAAQESAIARHTGSIADWTQDETNRDRLAAWSQGLAAWRTSPLWGTGLGTTGVAALRTRPATAFVTESQVLKSLVELGPLGLLALAYLWFQIARTGYRTLRATTDPTRQTLLLGILTGLLVVFIEGWVYQNLEVKQVNAYFWTLVGSVAFLAAATHRAQSSQEAMPQPPEAPASGESATERE